jgi:hypothetical protein
MHVCLCVHVLIRAQVHEYICVCMCLCVYMGFVWGHVCASVQTYSYVHECACVHMYSCVHMCAYRYRCQGGVRKPAFGGTQLTSGLIRIHCPRGLWGKCPGDLCNACCPQFLTFLPHGRHHQSVVYLGQHKCPGLGSSPMSQDKTWLGASI